VVGLLIAEASLFAVFIVAYLFYIGKSLNGPYPKDVLEVPILNTVYLLASSVTVGFAVRALRQGDPRRAGAWLPPTVVLGAAFLVGTAMPAFAANAGGVLTEAQIDALVSGMLARWSQPSAFTDVSLPPYDAAEAIANGSGARGDPERGWAVYATACAGCHGADGNGGAQGGSVVDASYLALVSDHALWTAVIAGRTDLGMPDWRQDIPGQALTLQEIADVVAWLVSQRRPVVGRTASSAEARRPQP
jgi:mono/diheme cytochrome c family protein